MTNKKTDKTDKKKTTKAGKVEAKPANKTIKKPVVKASPAAAPNKKTTAPSVSQKKTAPTDKEAPKKEAKSSKAGKKESLVISTVVTAPLSKPTQEEALSMVVKVMNNFITAKQEKSMEHFFHTISRKWQEMTTVEKLNTAFSTVIADQTDWNFLKKLSPVLMKDGLTDLGDWVVVGVYPTKPKKLIFDQIFINENNEWKLAELKLFTSD